MKEEKVMLQPPPRLLLGVAMLFWGAMSEYALVGFLSAIVLEARHWTKLRWEFGEKGFARAWQLSIVILIIVAVIFLISDEADTPSASLSLLAWLPIIFLPLALAQQYASDEGVPLICFSFIARRKIERDRCVGRSVKLNPCYIGFPFLGVILISSGLGSHTIWAYTVCVTVLFGIGLFFMRRERPRLLAWFSAYTLAALIGVSVSLGIFYLYSKYSNRDFTSTETVESAREIKTALGQIKTLQLSSDIDWRYYQDEGKAPTHLRLAIYNRYTLNAWQTVRRSPKLVEKIDPDRSSGGDFEFLFTDDTNFFYEKKHLSTELPHLSRVVGLVKDESLIPLPLNPRRFEKTATNGFDVSSMGSTRLDDPADSALSIKISSGSQIEMDSIDLDPTLTDLVIPKRELEGLETFWTSIGIDDLPQWKITPGQRSRMTPVWQAHAADRHEQQTLLMILRATFMRDFEYSLQLGFDRGKNDKNDGPMSTHAVSDFLNAKLDQKRGHCEYFATSSALLLRRAGIPTRYVVGYALDERGQKKNEYLLRGLHAHAWAQAYLGGTWVDEAGPDDDEPIWRCRGGQWVEVDNTPPSWLAQSSSAQDWKRRLADWWQKARPDLIIWFNGPVVSIIVILVLYGSAAALIIWLVYRLWTTRSGRDPTLDQSWEKRALSGNPLADFEDWLAKKIGPRPIGMPLGEWLKNEAPELVRLYQEARFARKENAHQLSATQKEARKRLKK